MYGSNNSDAKSPPLAFPVRIPSRKKKYLPLFTLFTLLVILDGLVIIGPQIAAEDGSVIILVLGLAPALFLLSLMAPILFKLISGKPGLYIDEHRIIDRSGLVPGGDVPWDEIAGMSLIEIKGRKFIKIHLNSPDDFMESQKNFFSFMYMMHREKQSGSPILITPHTLVLKSVAELWNIMNESFVKIKKHSPTIPSASGLNRSQRRKKMKSAGRR